MLTLKVISDLIKGRPQYKKTKRSDIKKIWMANVVKKKLSIEDTPRNKIKLQGIIVKGLKAKDKPITLNKPKTTKRIETGPLNKGKVVKAPAKPVVKTNIVIEVKDYGRGIDKSDISGFRKLSYKEVFGSRAKKQPGNLGKEYYLKVVTTQKDKDQLEQLSRGYSSEIRFFKISDIDKKFGLEGEESISHTDIRRGKLGREPRK